LEKNCQLQIAEKCFRRSKMEKKIASYENFCPEAHGAFLLKITWILVIYLLMMMEKPFGKNSKKF